MRNEKILVVETSYLDKMGIKSSNSIADSSSKLSSFVTNMLLNKTNWKFMNRKEAESDNSFKQIIPYVILNKDDKILSYKRGNKSGEKRLVDKISIGIGGHVNTSDCKPKYIDFLSICGNAIKRELKEEIGCYNFSWHVPTPSALIRDDSNEVGKVHLGLLYFIDVNFHLKVKNLKYENSMQEPDFKTFRELLYMQDRMETWSKISINTISNLIETN